ncbi:MAG TPA: amidohydrolase family protein [Nitrososphaerales archaeon]|nr:amidohydrolase family protein [Nitrososphaerales archaeon]
MIIDFHNHYYPKAYMDELKNSTGYASVTRDSAGRLVVEYIGDYNIVADAHVNLEDRLTAMKKYEIDMEVLTLTTPGVEREAPELGIELAKLTNDEYGRISEKYPDRFTALATLPMQDPQAAVEELDRAVNECGLRGAMIFSNVNGRTLDSKEFLPVFEKAWHLGVPLFIHPTSPINSSGMEEFRLVPIMGFGVDTSLAILRLVFSGVLERLPGLKLVSTHTGGIFPYLRGRIEIGYHAYPECKVNISKPPSTYLQKIWLDTVCYDGDVLMSSYSYVGADKIVLGTDFPHQISDLENAVRRVRALKIGEEKKEKILGGNAMKLLKL